MSRALRILLVANDGFSTGHVTRALAIARGLARGARARGLELSTLLVTTSEADALLAREPIAVVRLPAPVRARRSGIADPERRRLVRGAIDAVVEGFAPDLIVVDTFPSGPHGELAGLGRRAKRVLVRRAVPDDRADLMTTGLGDYDAVIVADDAGATSSTAAVRQIRVPPITLADAPLDRAAARRALGLPSTGHALLVTAGGGGDEDAATRVRALAEQLARVSRTASGVQRRDAPRLASDGGVAHSPAPDARAGTTRLDGTIGSLDTNATTVALALGPLDTNDATTVVLAVGSLDTNDAATVALALGPLDTNDATTVALALGPLDTAPADLAGVTTLRVTPLQPYLAAFDGAFSAAGYNTAHELAAAGVPTALLALPRPFDDQAARARRLADGGFARVLDRFDDDAIVSALGWMRDARVLALTVDGADRAADALFDLVGVRA